MSPEDQEFMAFSGLVAWTECVIEQSLNTSTAQNNIFRDEPHSILPDDRFREAKLRAEAMRAFQCQRHFFVTAAHKLVEYRHWIHKLKFVPDEIFSELDDYENDIEHMRNMNEHVIEYFLGKGKFPDDWVHTSEGGGMTDASSTINTKIGNRLDWAELGEVAKRLLEELRKISPTGTYFRRS